MFVDEINVKLIAGKGGDGCTSFHHEKCMPNLGPDGANGGHGASIIFEVDKGLRTLVDLRYNKILKDKNTVWLEGNKIPTNNNRYDYNIINILCDYYIQVSRRYNKLISTVAFSEFINITTTTIDLWKDTEPSTLTFKIWKKLQGLREDSLKDKAADSGNVMGVFQIGRREFAWDMPGVREDQHARRSLTDAELPKLSENNQTKAIETDVSRDTQFQTI